MSNHHLEVQHQVLTERLAAIYMAISKNVRDKEVSAILKEDARLFEAQLESLELELMGIQQATNNSIKVCPGTIMDGQVYNGLPESKL